MAIIQRNVITPCDLRDKLSDYPCLKCLSDSQLWMVFFLTLNYIYNYLNNTDATPVERLQELGCQNCLTDSQLLQAVVSKMVVTAAGLGYEAAAGFEDAACTTCADPKQIKAAVASLLCGIIGQEITEE